MKKLLLVAAVSCFACACGDGSKSSSSSADTTAAAPAAVDSSSAKTDTTAKAAMPALKDGLMTMKDGKMMVVKSGAWVALDAPVTCTNGRKVALDGTVSKGDKKRKLEEGMMIDKDGQIMDKDGKMMDTSGWD